MDEENVKTRNFLYFDIISYTCYPENIFTSDLSEKRERLTCPICYHILRKPTTEIKNNHIFGKDCLNEIKRKCENEWDFNCPLCKETLNNTDIITNEKVKDEIGNFDVQCYYFEYNCKWKGKCKDIDAHLIDCVIHNETTKVALTNIVELIKNELNKEINPHLIKEHNEIYINYVDDWNWLSYDERDWKWWWWADNPWWNNKPCIECNILWHKYENPINLYEEQRINFLKLNNEYKE